MKCLSICQPWAWAIIHGPKRVENRTWPTTYRGPLLIHAGKSSVMYDAADPADWRSRYGVELPPANRLAWGVIIGQVELAACVQIGTAQPLTALDPDQAAWLQAHPFTEGPWCWILKRPRPLAAPVEFRGQQGLFHVPADVVQLPPPEVAAPAGPAKARPWLYD